MSPVGNPRGIYPTLFWDHQNAVLVDTGLPGQLDDIRQAMENAGVPFEKLTKVVLTHQDMDHIGSLPAVVKAADGRVEVLAHEADKPYIEGDKPLIKMNPQRTAKMLESLPVPDRTQAEALFRTPPKAKVDRTVTDGETLPYCGGITVIYTPGHTPGHISLYHNPTKTLVTGDALVAVNGQLMGPNERVTPDMESALASLKKLTKYDIQTVICYHGGIITDNTNQRLAELAGS